MESADMAFSAFGTTLYELAYMGIPTIIIYNFSSDKPDAKRFARLGSAIVLGHHSQVSFRKIARAFTRLAKNTRLLSKMNRQGMKIVDGRGAARLCSIIKSLARN
jgi:spore coat polysaccharide biosynthesis predicted glycosyltransferase SpsG